MLQRSRTRESAERKAKDKARVRLWQLQRSRTRESAESREIPASPPRRSRFNGAALVRARRVGDKGVPAPECVASTEPHS